MSEVDNPESNDINIVSRPPKGLALLMVLGPGLIWVGEYIGSGEVIMATRTGAMLGIAVLWVPVIAILAKYWIGLAGARYTVCTGEGMIDMMSRTPGPRNWVLWPVFIGQISAAAISMGGIATLAGIFASHFIPLSPFILGWIITLLVVGLVWNGRFDVIKKVMSILVLVIILGVVEVARTTWPGFGAILNGMFGFNLPEVPEWALTQVKVAPTAWGEVLPLLGWAAGGFASQVWYSYWVLGAGYGMAKGRGYGIPLDEEQLSKVTVEDANRLKGWCRVVSTDATLAVTLGIIVTVSFMVAGAGVLGPAQVLPEGPEVATQLSQIFSERWGGIGAKLFILAGLAAMLSTLTAQFAGWPRLLADCGRSLFPKVNKFSWKIQFRSLLVFFAVFNLIIVHSLGFKPVVLVKLAAILDGILLTPLQALAVALGLYLVMPKFFSPDARKILTPGPILAIGLALAFLLFGYCCIFQVPKALGF